MYYIARNYKSVFNAAGKAKIDCETSLERLGFKNLGFKQSSIPNSVIGTLKNFFGISLALIRLPLNSTLCTQYPNSKFRNLILSIAKLKSCKVITIVHDVKCLKGRQENINKELSQIITSDAIIVHNQSMKQWFLEQNTKTPIIVLGIFDYISEKKPIQNQNTTIPNHFSIAYAGGFSEGKNSYIYNFDLLENKSYNLKLYGIGFDPQKRKVNEKESIINYQGSFPSDQIAYNITADFGLIWDGVSTESCSGQYGQYLKYNNPHKTSLYILCGLPVIVWKEAAIASFILENNLGISISNLKDLNKTLESISKEDYRAMKENVIKLQDDIMSGEFISRAVNKSLELI